MPTVVLARSLTYEHRGTHFRRGIPVEVTEGDYLFLLSQGFIDPTHEIQEVHPRRLSRVPAGTEVPVIRTGGLGDVLMVLPGLRELAARYPRLRFTYATAEHFVPLMRDATFLHRATSLGKLTGRYPYAIDLRGYSERDHRERYDRTAVFARYLTGGDLKDWSYPLKATPEEQLRGRVLTGQLEHGRPVVGVVVGSHSLDGLRNWPKVYVETLAELCFDHGMRVVLIDDRIHEMTPRLAAAGVRSLAGHLTIPMLVQVLSSLDFLVAPDTGALHLAEALGVKSVGLFTAVPPEARACHYQTTRTLYAGVKCAPCFHSPTCGAQPGTALCAVEIRPMRVFSEIQWLAQHEPPYDYRAPYQAPSAPVQFAMAGRAA